MCVCGYVELKYALPQFDRVESELAGQHSDSSRGLSQPGWVDAAHRNCHRSLTLSLKFAAEEIQKLTLI